MTTNPKTLKPLSLLLHRASNRAYVMTRDEQGSLCALFHGEHGSAAAERAYRAFLADFYSDHSATRGAAK